MRGMAAVKFLSICALSAILLFAASGGVAHASSVVYTFSQGGNGPAGDGPVSAKATFSTFTNLPVNGYHLNGIQVKIDNLQVLAGNNGEGQAITGIKFTLGSALGQTVTAPSPPSPGSSNGLLQDQGPVVSTTSTSVTSLGTQTGVYPSTLHWGTPTIGASTTLVSPGGSPSKPDYLIIGKLGAGGSYASSYQQHDPSFYQTATFWIYDPTITGTETLTTSNIFNVNFAFGTGPSWGGSATGGQNPTPEPASWVLMGGVTFGGLLFGVRRHFRKQRALVAA
ncbi:MAG TPA: hypothetical protein VGY58_16935 [Gemmataceae bacterium]|jgi:hypothetical protein|nr:hypothetical protein [Gemmataceae bacterium]